LVARGATLGDITSSSTLDKLSAVDLISEKGDLMKKVEVHKCGGNRYMRMENQDIQVGVGERRSQLDTSASVVVLALNVPSWILVLKSLGFSSISLYCEEEACWFRRALALEVQEDFSLEEMESAEWYGMDQRSFFIQGDAEFCSRVGPCVAWPELVASSCCRSSCGIEYQHLMLTNNTNCRVPKNVDTKFIP
jgi:hypothetical protein